MTQKMFVLALAIGLIGPVSLFAQCDPATEEGACFDLTIDPAAADIRDTGGTADFSVILATRNEATQGWQLGVFTTPDAGVNAEITALQHSAIIDTINGGGRAGFPALNWFATQTSTSGGSCNNPCPSLSGATAFTQGITIDLGAINVLPATPDGVAIVDFTVTADGPEGAQVAIDFGDVGDPVINTIIVAGGLSYAPAVQDGAVITLVGVPKPQISNIQVTNIKYNQATVTWDTALAADSVVDYGVDPATDQTESDSALVTSHSITLTGLSELTTYAFTVTSTTDEGGTETSAVDTFSTPEQPPCADATEFTLAVQDGAGEQGTLIESVITLNFDSIPGGDPFDVQGWSYGVCIADPSKLRGDSVTVAGTDTETVKDGGKADFDIAKVYENGASHAVTIDLGAVVVLPNQNGWTDLVVTYEMLTDVDDDGTFVNACNNAIGDPVVENLMVVGGLGEPLNAFEGEDPSDPDTGCCDPAVCNQPGFFTNPSIQYRQFLPGDANNDGRLDLADGVYLLSALFRGGPQPPCAEAADFNGDGVLDASDAVASIFYYLQPTEADLTQLEDDYGLPPAMGWPEPAGGTTPVCVAEPDLLLGCDGGPICTP
jgi:hypothetical protein